MNDIALVADRFLTSLFQLAGVDTIEVPDDDAAARKVEELIAKEQYKIIVITENVALRITNRRMNLLLLHRLYPVFVVIPEVQGSIGERENELKQLISQSLGIKLKLGS